MKANSPIESEDAQKLCNGQCVGRLGATESLQVQRTLLDGDVVRRELRFVFIDDDELIEKALLTLFKRVNEINRENPDVELDLEEFIKHQNKEIERLENEEREMMVRIVERVTLYDELVVLHEEITTINSEDPFIEHLKERLQLLINQNDPIDSKIRVIHEDIEIFVPNGTFEQSKMAMSEQPAELAEKVTTAEPVVQKNIAQEPKRSVPPIKSSPKSVKPLETKNKKSQSKEAPQKEIQNGSFGVKEVYEKPKKVKSISKSAESLVAKKNKPRSKETCDKEDRGSKKSSNEIQKSGSNDGPKPKKLESKKIKSSSVKKRSGEMKPSTERRKRSHKKKGSSKKKSKWDSRNSQCI
ncbi:hypothetical protein L596_007963 [Steinernema carpocapsae]|uniref:Uncharacterized protein n=1 Tax=Steinernema carpocapsae TaxID=34508 RepID=A0A4U5PB42_STECR|nr:hypothetical protein L596_007963 [Steinernema carpocapsae]